MLLLTNEDGYIEKLFNYIWQESTKLENSTRIKK